jgi:glucoamylase
MVIAKNLVYLLNAYQYPTMNLWEEVNGGSSFFARAVQLRCFQAISSNTYGIPVPAATAAAISWLQTALQSHWNGTYYVSIVPQSAALPGYDPNIDIVLASIYGAISCTDTQLLATAAQLRSQWADSSSSSYYPINGTDQTQGLGPMMGRYPGDKYDGDTAEPVPGGHPWALCTCNFAELYYRLANAIGSSKSVPFNNLSSPFFAQIGVTASTTWDEAVTALQNAGDSMLNAVISHSDHLELSEQFDGTSGYEKSVSDLTWSYAAFLSAVRAKTGSAVAG